MKRFMGIVLALTCVALTSCGLLPEEETFAAAPVIREYAREAFRLAAVERGDMELTKKVTCTFMPVQTESLAYEVGGIAHDGVYVAAGDHVEAGQLLASLDTSQLQAQLEDAALRLELARLRRDAAEENRALALKRLRIEGGDEAQVNAAFDWEGQPMTDSILRQKRKKWDTSSGMYERTGHEQAGGKSCSRRDPGWDHSFTF